MKIRCASCGGHFQVEEEQHKDAGFDCPYCDTHFESIPPAEKEEELREKGESPVESDDNAETESSGYGTDKNGEIFLESPGKPLGVKFLALAIGLLSFVTGGRFLFQLLNGTIDSPVLYPAYYVIGLSFAISIVMYNLFIYKEWARIVTIVLSIISIFVSGWALIQIFYLGMEAPLRVTVNYFIRVIFCVYFIFYLMIPQVKIAFQKER